MRKPNNIAQKFLGLVLAVLALTSSVSGQALPPGNKTWSNIGSGAAVYSLAIDPNNPNVIYAGGPGGVFKSTDGGASWHSSALAGDATVALVIDMANPNIVYAAIAFTNSCHFSYDKLHQFVAEKP